MLLVPQRRASYRCGTAHAATTRRTPQRPRSRQRRTAGKIAAPTRLTPQRPRPRRPWATAESLPVDRAAGAKDRGMLARRAGWPARSSAPPFRPGHARRANGAVRASAERQPRYRLTSVRNRDLQPPFQGHGNSRRRMASHSPRGRAAFLRPRARCPAAHPRSLH